MSDPLPPSVEAPLRALGDRLFNNLTVAETLPPALSALDRIPPGEFVRLAPHIIDAARLFHRWKRANWFGKPYRIATRHKEQIMEAPGLATPFLLHRDGRLREIALQRLVDGLPSPFVVTLLAYRLNDWVPEVRRAARDAACRVLPRTDATAIAIAAETLLLRFHAWSRWRSERGPLDAALGREDVMAALAQRLERATTGPAARLLSNSLRYPAIDCQLERLASDAKTPALRALALRTMLAGEARWPVGWAYEWAGVSMREQRRVRRFEARPLTIAIDAGPLVHAAASDRSVLLRREALDAVIRYQVDAATGLAIAARLANDPSPSVRERAAFIARRHQSG
ncbi:hypothetical protein [Sphingomicrobium arenosum]|uniref:hypothetical protein n=1 Tax=Sphingomicrobium arenosum TaxID=2233861 RepID=UPI002240AD25|nr:hypothetical protein [Sphingomicrobium arenosum]